MDNPTSALEQAIRIIGTQQALARKLGIRAPSVAEWRRRGRVPAERCAAIETATGGEVTRHDLRPDLFDPPADAAAASGEGV